MTALETSRLKLQQWQDDDLAVFARMCADPAVMRYFPALLTRAESDKLANRIRSRIAVHGWGFWALRLRATDEFMGFVGLNHLADELPFAPGIEIGWRLAKKFWGNGYATEAGQEALCYAFKILSAAEVFAFTTISNERSQAVMQRLGMSNTGQNFAHPAIDVVSPLREHVLYRVTADS